MKSVAVAVGASALALVRADTPAPTNVQGTYVGTIYQSWGNVNPSVPGERREAGRSMGARVCALDPPTRRSWRRNARALKERPPREAVMSFMAAIATVRGRWRLRRWAASSCSGRIVPPRPSLPARHDASFAAGSYQCVTDYTGSKAGALSASNVKLTVTANNFNFGGSSSDTGSYNNME
jgi:hypothetical protein